MPKAQKIFDKKTSKYKGIIYTVEGKNKESFTLRDFSKSSLKDGSKPWTIDINGVKGIKDGAEIKFEKIRK